VELAKFDNWANVTSGSTGDEIRTEQLLPIRDRKADVAYDEIIVCRSDWLDCPLSDR